MPTSSTFDLDDPLAAYQQHLEPAHAHRAAEYFDDLVAISGVDPATNIKTVSELRELEGRVSARNSQRWRWIAVLTIGVLAGAGAAVLAFSRGGASYLLLTATVAIAALLIVKVRPILRELGEILRELKAECDRTRAEAWKQMESLNSLYRWDVTQMLLQQTLPDVQLDKYVTQARLDDLEAVYGLSPNLGRNISVMLAQSGTFRENPFVVARFLEHWMGVRQYSGSLRIGWVEHVRQPDGRVQAVNREETLVASVTKPFPEFRERSVLMYGHEAAPSLSFSRQPSRLSRLNDGAFNDWRKEQQVRRVERKARRSIASGKGLTVMANRDFEALFGATNRSDEVAFRLLFTPSAQEQMLQLLKGRNSGYGDDFSFSKSGLMNVIEPAHLAKSPLDGDPRRFRNYDLVAARSIFLSYQAEYFRSFYFSLLPLLTIPLYRERRSTPVAGQAHAESTPCAWEDEGMANWCGEGHFRPGGCATRSVLKTTYTQLNDSVRLVQVVASGYGVQARIDYVPVRGGDGRVHPVPVPWDEYIPLQASRQMLVGVAEGDDANQSSIDQDWSTAMTLYGADENKRVVRGALAGVVL